MLTLLHGKGGHRGEVTCPQSCSRVTPEFKLKEMRSSGSQDILTSQCSFPNNQTWKPQHFSWNGNSRTVLFANAEIFYLGICDQNVIF